MVRIEKGKIIIEINTHTPIDDIQDITGGLLHLLGSLDPEMCTASGIRPVIKLLEELQPTFDQLGKAYG